MTEITDVEGAVFDVEKHLLTDDPVAPFITRTGKFRKIREGSKNDPHLIELWNESLSKQSPAMVISDINDEVKPEPVAKEVTVSKIDFEALAKETNSGLEKRKGSYVFYKGNRHVSLNPDNYADTNQARLALRKFGITA